jgi:hypothetical protein
MKKSTLSVKRPHHTHVKIKVINPIAIIAAPAIIIASFAPKEISTIRYLFLNNVLANVSIYAYHK